jgi:L-histidine Nalpha-methyltransferase
MDGFFASPELQICRSFREACDGNGSTIIHGLPGPDPVQDFARAIAAGLLATPRRLECRFLYDSQGSDLFDRITQQPEYYLTRTETSILAAHASRIRELTGPVHLVELGSGSSKKTEHLLQAWLGRAPTACYVPVDISESALAGACSAISAAHPQVRVIGVNCEYREAFPLFAELSPALVLWLGSSIGNLAPEELRHFLGALADSMASGDFFLIGVDLVKAPWQLEAAYNDAAGVTANFTRNIFARMNRELDCAIEIDAIEHVANYDPDSEQIDIYARFTRQQTFYLAPLGMYCTIPDGEMVQTEISRKFRLKRFLPYLERFGFEIEEVFSDPHNWYALLLLRRAPRYISSQQRIA